MQVDWPEEFDRWLDHAEELGGERIATVVAMLQRLQELDGEPLAESATFMRVRQARRYVLWRVAHPFHPDFACRLIVWFPSSGKAVIVVVGGDKVKMGRCLLRQRSRARRGRSRPVDPTVRGGVVPKAKFVRGNERISRMSRDPKLAPRTRAARDAMDAADRGYVRGLAELRRAADQTQVEIAEKLGISQGSVSKIEGREDMLLSTLNNYVTALGGHVRVVVDFDDGATADIELDALSPHRPGSG